MSQPRDNQDNRPQTAPQGSTPGERESELRRQFQALSMIQQQDQGQQQRGQQLEPLTPRRTRTGRQITLPFRTPQPSRQRRRSFITQPLPLEGSGHRRRLTVGSTSPEIQARIARNARLQRHRRPSAPGNGVRRNSIPYLGTAPPTTTFHERYQTHLEALGNDDDDDMGMLASMLLGAWHTRQHNLPEAPQQNVQQQQDPSEGQQSSDYMSDADREHVRHWLDSTDSGDTMDES